MNQVFIIVEILTNPRKFNSENTGPLRVKEIVKFNPITVLSKKEVTIPHKVIEVTPAVAVPITKRSVLENEILLEPHKVQVVTTLRMSTTEHLMKIKMMITIRVTLLKTRVCLIQIL